MIRFTVQTQCFDLLRQTYMLQTLCLPFFSNILNPNTVFALLHIDINDLIFTDARLWGTLRAQRYQYTALPYANIDWFGSQCQYVPACCDSQLLTLFKMHRDTNEAKPLYAKWDRS